MTMHHFMASNKPLPLGSYGRNPTLIPLSELKCLNKKGKKKKRKKKPLSSELANKYVEIYETEVDLLGISIAELNGYDEIKDKFSHPFMYELTCGHHRKCYRELFKYLDENLSEYDSVEIYTCWSGDEAKSKNDGLDLKINLKTLYFENYIGKFKLNEKRYIDELSERFSLREKQYVVVTK